MTFIQLTDRNLLDPLRCCHFALLAVIPSSIYWIHRIRNAMQKKRERRLPTNEYADEMCATHAPPVSILIPAWNEEKAIDRAIMSTLQVRYPAFEVIVIAGGEDNTYNKAARWTEIDRKVTVVRQQPLGKNAALNEGLKHAKGEIVVILDADTKVSQEWLGNLVDPIVKGEASATTGNHFPDAETNWLLSYESMVRIKNRFLDGDRSLFGGASIAISRRVLNELGGFNEEIIAGVDWDLSETLEKRGFRTMFVSDAKVSTNLPRKFTHFLKTEIRWKRALFRLSLRSFRNIHAATPPEIVRFLKKNVFFLTPFLFAFSPCFLLMYASVILSIAEIFWFTYVFYFSLVLLNSMVLAFEVFCYTDQRRWLKYVWVSPVLLMLEFIFTVYAVLTFRKLRPWFKGPRKL